MRAFHNDENIKQFYLDRIQAHYDANEIVKGQRFRWKDNKGSAVGCTIHCEDFGRYETELGIPLILARIEENIFDRLPNDKAKEWPKRFLSAVNVGADLSLVTHKLLHWNLTENLILKDSDDNEIQNIITQCREAIQLCANLFYALLNGGILSSDDIQFVHDHTNNAWLVAGDDGLQFAESAAYSALRSVKSIMFDTPEIDAIRAIVWSAEYAASIRDEGVSEDEARNVAYEKIADKLIEIISSCV